MGECKPWKQGDVNPNWVLDGGGGVVARCRTGAAAARIVREHNAHDDLLEALKLTTNVVEAVGHCDGRGWGVGHASLARKCAVLVRAAIAQVEGK